MFDKVDLQNFLKFRLDNADKYPSLYIDAKQFGAVKLATNISHDWQLTLNHGVSMDEGWQLSLVNFEFAEMTENRGW